MFQGNFVSNCCHELLHVKSEISYTFLVLRIVYAKTRPVVHMKGEELVTMVRRSQGNGHLTIHSAVSDAGMDGSQYSQYRGRSARTAAPDLVPAGLPSCHSPSEAERCAYTPPSDRRPDPPPGGFRERTPPPDQLTYTPPAERCIFTLPSQPRSAAIKQLPTFGGRASPPPPPPPPPLSPTGHPVEEEGLLV